MYDKKKKCWIANSASEIKTGITETEKLYSEFIEADKLLAGVTNGTKNVEAIYHMERIAKQGYAPACLAMAQMFENGWAVAANPKLAYNWYQKAAEAGSSEAKAYLEALKRKARRKKLFVFLTIVTVAAAVALGVFVVGGFLKNKSSDDVSKKGSDEFIRLPKGVTLVEEDDVEEHSAVLKEIRDKYDTDEMKRGDVKTDRVLLVYKEKGLDLADFDIAEATTDGELTVLQFRDHDEAVRCYEYLKQRDDVITVTIDYYYAALQESVQTGAYDSTSSVDLTTYHSSYSGYDYYTWGAMAMEMDQYAAYLRDTYPGKHLTVAVIDTGVERNTETQNRILDGADIVNTGICSRDVGIHGTHVSGTIIDSTQGLDIDILPVNVFFDIQPGETSPMASTSTVVLGVEYVYRSNYDVRVINMSLGGMCDEDGLKDYYVQQAINNGITVVVAAGNETVLIDDEDCCPAHIENCITVSAIDENGIIADFSNYGNQVDVCAPGVDVLSYVPAPDMLAFLNGTSMAAPHVSALAAMITLEYERYEPDTIQHLIKSYCDGDRNDKQHYGEGMPLAGYFVEESE